MLVGYYIEQHGGTVNYYDVNTGDLDLKTDSTDVYLIGYWEQWVKDIDWVKETKRSYTFVDPWREMVDMVGHTVINYGDTRKK